MKRRVVLFGTSYGASYVEPLLGGRAFELVAIGARGSRRSRELARLVEVPLYLSAAELLRDARPDAAVVAVPDADQLVRQLLRAGVHVLAEHPVTPRLVAAAARFRPVFLVNGHFADLPAPRRFIELCRAAGRPRAVVADLHPRALYSALDILARATGLAAFAPPRVVLGRAPQPGWWPAAALATTSGRVPVSIQLTAGDPARDDGGDHVVGHRLSVAFAEGTITLVDTHGPVVRATRPSGARGALWRLVSAHAGSVTVSRAVADRLAANGRALARFARAIEGKAAPAELRADARRAAAVAKAWDTFRRTTRG